MPIARGIGRQYQKLQYIMKRKKRGMELLKELIPFQRISRATSSPGLPGVEDSFQPELSPGMQVHVELEPCERGVPELSPSKNRALTVTGVGISTLGQVHEMEEPRSFPELESGGVGRVNN